jgi:hypothetical protein
MAGLKLSAYKTRDIHRPIPIPSLQATDRFQTGSTPLRPTHYSQRPKIQISTVPCPIASGTTSLLSVYRMYQHSDGDALLGRKAAAQKAARTSSRSSIPLSALSQHRLARAKLRCTVPSASIARPPADDMQQSHLSLHSTSVQLLATISPMKPSRAMERQSKDRPETTSVYV